ncbi:MAG: hypothetical protein OEO79_08175 [Gemmatimonadota bacterium]|nr:hypothetical protein [Gemmatimonadota bacterium]MDH3421819.1 hypothetical protein [Gemmatimonadota bacterium]
MRDTYGRACARRYVAMVACTTMLAVASVTAPERVNAQAEASDLPDFTGVWDGGGRVRRINGPNAPWVPGENFPVLNERALAFQSIFDEAIAPKYDCVPSASPAIQYDPYYMEVVQWPDRVLLRYEKDDQLRTVWLDGREPPPNEYTVQGFSVGRYEGDTLVVETTNFVFDITGFDDYNGIPSSQLKKVTELYWATEDQLNMTLTLEDPLFLREPASYTTRWLPAREGYKLNPYECDAIEARRSVRFMVPRYN